MGPTGIRQTSAMAPRHDVIQSRGVSGMLALVRNAAFGKFAQPPNAAYPRHRSYVWEANSKGELDRLRLRAGGMGITIRTHSANRPVSAARLQLDRSDDGNGPSPQY